jgi:gluconokinase
MQYIIGVDIGTTGTKAIAFATSGEVLSTAYESYPVVSSEPGAHELEPLLLLEAVIHTISQVIQEMAGKQDLMAVSLSAAMHSLMAVDGGGVPLTRLITWADLRSNAYAIKLKSSDSGKRIYRYSGTPIHPMSPLCKIMWLKAEHPDIFSRAYKFISIKEYIWFRFFGNYSIDYSIASATGLFDIFSLKWYPESLLTAGISEEQLSQPVSPFHMERFVSKEFRDILNLPQGLPFIIGANDGCLANLGTRAISPEDMALTIGTSGAVRMISKRPVEDSEARIFNYILAEDLYVSGGPINNGAVVVKWFLDHFMDKRGGPVLDFGASIEAVNTIPPGSEGLIFLPYLLGERAPVWDAHARAVFFGIHSGHGPNHFLRAVMEGICFSLYQISLVVKEAIGPAERIYASGGFIQSSLWLQMVADIFNKELCVTNPVDASAIGAAIMGMFALGMIQSLEDSKKIISVQQRYIPDFGNHERYMRNFSVFNVLYGKLKTEFEQISHF